jgi:hypothetical protein
MILIVISDYFLKQRKPVDLCNGEELCFLCGTDWILRYYLDELRLQRINRGYKLKITTHSYDASLHAQSGSPHLFRLISEHMLRNYY